ncbi:lantibiotic dehydratase [Bowmanella denitrificans]|uniref:lantibiotic dehydratase n=1 Tax=Bowmanella denitrificans TaxID=366582 RepID=UPI001558D814|nr:lantibiotic dehydratase [Bowmanella denitrificans]
MQTQGVAEFFILRTPRLAFSELTQWHSSDKRQLREKLNAWLHHPETLEALYLASPSLLQRLHQWQQDPDSKRGQKMELALAKYFMRMAGRATPFGLFSAISLGKVAESDHLALKSNDGFSRKTRLDSSCLLALKARLCEQDWVAKDMPLVTNDSLYKMGAEYRYVESYFVKEQIHYRLTSADISEPLQLMVESAREPVRRQVLLDNLMSLDTEISCADAETFVAELVEARILLPVFNLPISGDDMGRQFQREAAALGYQQLSAELEAILSELDGLDQQQHNPPESYQALYQRMQAMALSADEAKSFQVDMLRHAPDLTLSKDKAEQVLVVARHLSRLLPAPGNPFSDIINKINNEFVGRMMPLKAFLDDESGWSMSSDTGYATPLLKGLNLAAAQAGMGNAGLSALDRLLLKKLMACADEKITEISLTEKDIDQHQLSQTSYFADSFAASLELYGDKADTIRLTGFYGPSAANLLGRFCHLSPQLTEYTRDLLKQEEAQRPDALFAEIIHLPSGRMGNVIARPVLREYEICYLTSAGVPVEKQIGLDDLYVYVEQGLVRLWSQSHQREVIPRLSSAHNTMHNSLGLYKFLAGLQKQQVQYPFFNWPALARERDYLPRVRFGNVLLSVRTWFVPRDKLTALAKLCGDDYSQAWKTLQSQLQLPDWLLYKISDNALTLTLANPIMLDVLLGETKGQSLVTLEELPETEWGTAATLDGQSLRSEVLLPFYQQNDDVLAVARPQPPQENVSREFVVGSEWLSIKFYGGNSTVEKYLLEVLSPLLFAAKQGGLIEGFFFLRYGDPDWHLRLRLHGDGAKLLAEMVPMIYQHSGDYVDNGPIKQVVIDTYKQELERYGGKDAMPLAENLFCINSETALRLLDTALADMESYRWQAVLAGCHSLLEAFALSNEDKLELISLLREGYGREFGDSRHLRKQLGQKYRDVQDQVINLLNRQQMDEVQTQLWSILELQSQPLHVLVQGYQQLDKEGALQGGVKRVLGSFMHMFCNRMFKAYGREQEFVIYDLLRRYYQFKCNADTASKDGK